MSEGTVLSSSDAEAIAFISKAHTSMIALGYTFIVTDEGEQIDLSAFNINLESIALAIAKSNHISGI